MIRITIRWVLFVTYIGIFFSLPLYILWNTIGLAVGLTLTLSFIAFLGFHGSKRIAERIHLRPLPTAESPELHALIREYAQRLRLTPPKVSLIESQAMNVALFGFSKNRAELVVTRGIVTHLRPEQLAAIIGRELSYLWHGEVFCESWLSQFLSLLDSVVALPTHSSGGNTKEVYPIQLFLRQAVLYPLTLIPCFLLRAPRRSHKIDVKSIRLSGQPRSLAEALRIIDATKDRHRFQTHFSTRHLFLVPPPSRDPLMRTFFDTETVKDRVKAIEKLCHLAPITC